MTTPRWLRRRLWLVVGLVTLVVAVGTVTSLGGAQSATYRTATVVRGAVQVTVQAAGTTVPVTRAELSFSVSGTTTEVPAAVGTQVRMGQLLAQLDTTGLDAQVASARAQLGSAQARLAADRSGQNPRMVPQAARTGLPTGDAKAEVEKRQRVVLKHQRQADEALRASTSQLEKATSSCSGEAAANSCRDDLAAALAAQTEVGRLQQTVADDTVALDEAVRALLAEGDGEPPAATQPVTSTPATPTSTPQPGTPTSTPQPGTPPIFRATPAPRPSGPLTEGGPSTAPAPTPAARALTGPAAPVLPLGGAASIARPPDSVAGRAGAAPPPVSAAQLAADQAAVYAAEAALSVARQQLAQAVLVSPIDGTVEAVRLTAGAQVAPGAGGEAQIVVVGAGTNELRVSVGEGSVGELSVGDVVGVLPDSADTAFPGSVVAIGLLPSTDAPTNAVSYPVTIGLGDAGRDLRPGQGASVEITVAAVDDVLTVPTSAVHPDGMGHMVTVLRDGRPVPTPVVVGTLGAVRTEIVSGLDAGVDVVVADLTLPLPDTGLGGLRR